jgi:hypothetical protein
MSASPPIKPSLTDRRYSWEKVTLEAPFAPRDGAGALSFQDRMFLIGGWNPGDKKHFPLVCNNEVWSSAEGREWTLEKPNTFLDKSFDPASDWEGRHTAGYAVHQGKMWIVGGDANQGHYQNDVWNSADGKTWSRVTDHVPWGPRVLHHVVAFDGKLWLMGGQNLASYAPAETDRFDNDVWNSVDGKHWTRVLEHAPWSPRGMIGGAAVLHGRIWLLGGGTYDTPRHPTRQFFNEVWSTPDGLTWECHAKQPPWNPRQYHDVAVWDEQLWVLEGWNKANRNDVWRSPDGVNWYELPQTPWAIRHAASVFVHRDALWMVAGNNMESDVWKLVRA